MSFALPPTGSNLREMFDIEVLLRPRELPNFRQCVHSARATFAMDRAVRNVQFVCVRAAGEVELVQFGPKGGHKTLWTFGKV